jgi:hypothetical protein
MSGSIDLKNYLRKSILVGIKMKEAYKLSKMKRMMIADFDENITDRHKYKTFDKDEIKKMNDYIASYGANGEKEVIYNLGFSSIADYGRVYAPNSFGSFWSYVKNTVADEDYIDIDMVNSQANIIFNIATKDLKMSPEYDIPMLNIYVNRRQTFLDAIIKDYRVDAREAKLLMTSLMNGGTLYGWKNEKEIYGGLDVNNCYIFEKEMGRIAEKFFNTNYDTYDAVRADSQLKNITEGTEIKTKLFSRVCKNIEILCLEKLYQCCGRPKYGSLEHDGMRVQRSLFSSNGGEDGKLILDDVMKETLIAILADKDLGYDIEFIVKKAVDFMPMSEKDELDGNFEYFDGKYFEVLQTYADKKRYFEIFHFKVMIPFSYYQLSWSEHDYGKLELHETTQEQIAKAYRNRKYTKKIIERKENARGEIVEKPKTVIVKFTDDWLDDAEIRTYHNIDFIPYNKIATKLNYWDGMSIKTYNTFFGYSIKCNTPIPENGNKLLKIWSDLVFELCGENQKFYDLYVNSLAHKIQFPNEKPRAGAFIFKSKQGEGKNMSLVPFEVLLGEYYISSCDEKDFFGAYADGYYRKIIINLNECQLGKESRDAQGTIKAFITEEWKSMNQKFKLVVKVRNTALPIFYTNEQQPFAIDFRSGERRLNVAEGSGKYADRKKYGKKFWADMNTRFRSDEFIATFYNFLNTRDLSNVDWSQVKTEAYMDMSIKYHSSDILFICDWIERKILGHKTMNEIKGTEEPLPTRYTVASVFDDYKQFCVEYNIKSEYVLPQHKFMANLVDLKIGITSKRSSVNVFDMDLEIVKEKLLEEGFLKKDENYKPKEEDEEGGISLDEMYDL